MAATELNFNADRNPLAGRVIEPGAFVADTEAFIDVRIERSKGKASYSFIGPGVSQNVDQTINLTVPHGFNVGAASMPHGIINNPHLHYTAEVFICTNGSFQMHIGEHGEQTLDIEAGTIFSAPTWVFRGFENTGPDDGFMFVVLGGDDTGGIIWAPHILEEAAETGLYLAEDYSILDVNAGDDVSAAVTPTPRSELDGNVASYTDAELAARSIAPGELHWSDRALLSSVLDGHATAVAPVIGFGMTQDRTHRSPISNPHGFSVEWLRIEPGSSTGRHRHGDTQVLFLVEGDWSVEIDHTERDGAGAQLDSSPPVGSIVSVPDGAWRDFANVGSESALAVVVNGSDSPTRIEWAEDIARAASAAGFALDASGFVAPAGLIGGRP